MLVHSQSHTVEHVSRLLIDYPASHPAKETSDENKKQPLIRNKSKLQYRIRMEESFRINCLLWQVQKVFLLFVDSCFCVRFCYCYCK